MFGAPITLIHSDLRFTGTRMDVFGVLAVLLLIRTLLNWPSAVEPEGWWPRQRDRREAQAKRSSAG